MVRKGRNAGADDTGPPAIEGITLEPWEAQTISHRNNGAPEFVIDLDVIVNT
jgi:hypothetical protein